MCNVSGLGDDCVSIHSFISGVVTAFRLRTQANGSVFKGAYNRVSDSVSSSSPAWTPTHLQL